MTFKDLASLYKNPQEDFPIEKDQATIKVSAATSAVGFIYEKIRVAVEFKSEHLLRRLAIERILNRKVKLSSSKNEIGLFIVKELIRSRYLPNNKVPESKALEISNALEKYFELIETYTPIFKKSRKDVVDWVISVASYDVEQRLSNPSKRDALVELMATLLSKESDYELLDLAIAGHFSLNKADTPIVRFLLLTHKYNFWSDNVSKNNLVLVSKDLETTIEDIEKNIQKVERGSVLKFVRRQIAPFIVLIDLLKEDPSFSENYDDEILLETKVKNMCHLKYRQIRDRLKRMVFRSVIYIFLTKMLFALLLEIPLERFLYGSFSFRSIVINLGFPPTLMYLVGMRTKLPGEKNTDLILERVKNIVFKDELGITENERRVGKIKRRALSLVFRAFYFVVFVLSFGVVTYSLTVIGFSFIAIGIFLFFLSVVSFFAYVIKQSTKDILLVRDDDGVIGSFFDLFFLPVLRVGQKLSGELAKYNVMVFLLDFVVEAPLKSIIDVFDDWLDFVREKKEEVL